MGLPTCATAALGRVQVTGLSLEGDIIEVFRPIAKGAGLVQLTRADDGVTVLFALEPVELDFVRLQAALRNQRLHAEQKNGAVRFHDDANASFRRRSQDLSQSKLGARMQMRFGLFHVNELAGLGRVQRHQDRQCLRDTHTHVG